jgi:UDP-2,4-diacetamido-2,4,6-trideoxy-beta-L-altropyranose hydrolase
MKVVIRADASFAIGSGHVMRCLALAHQLRRNGANVTFVCRDHPGHLCEHIAGQGIPVFRLPLKTASPANQDDDGPLPAHYGWLGADWRADAEDTGRAMAGGAAVDWLIVDHYAIDMRWQRSVRPLTRGLMIIDDLADRRHDCDLLVDQNYFDGLDSRYDALTPAGCQRLLGPVFALLRPEFATVRSILRDRSGTVNRILISFGGVDATNETAKTIRAFRMLGSSDLEAVVIVGRTNPHRSEIESLCGERPGLRFRSDVADMATEMAEADLAIGAGGVSCWERCCVGLPAIVMAVSENQLAIADALARKGACLYLGRHDRVDESMIAKAIEKCASDADALRVMAQRAMAMTSGDGAHRICTTMLS